MNKTYLYIFAIFLTLNFSCTSTKKEKSKLIITEKSKESNTAVIDCNYSFDEAVKGSNAPDYILSDLTLVNVSYYSTDKKIHKGQILTNKKIAADIIELFEFMLKVKFPVAKAIPIVYYDWNDKISMQNNNTYSFCYRNVDFSKHAKGMAIDINPFFNPIRWKSKYKNIRTDRPIGAVYDTTVAGTFSPKHPVVLEFKMRNFRWGHHFTRNYDDHHFEK